MTIKNLFNQFVGTHLSETNKPGISQGVSRFLGGEPANVGHQNTPDTTGKSSSGLASGLVGGLAAGGIMSLLLSNKSARKFAGTAATYGGAALVGGAAYKMYKNWQHGNAVKESTIGQLASEPVVDGAMSEEYQLTLIKAMIAAAKSDGHIDRDEQQKIFTTVDKMELSPEDKGMLFDLLSLPISVEEIARGISNEAQKAEVYFASCLVINPELPAEREHLNRLAVVLNLPPELAQELEQNAHDKIIDAA